MIDNRRVQIEYDIEHFLHCAFIHVPCHVFCEGCVAYVWNKVLNVHTDGISKK